MKECSVFMICIQEVVVVYVSPHDLNCSVFLYLWHALFYDDSYHYVVLRQSVHKSGLSELAILDK